MSIIEKLGITPIEVYSGGLCIINQYYCHENKVRELEQQRNELLEALIDLMKGVDGLPPLTAIEGVLTEQWNICIEIIEKACYPKKWEEIKCKTIGE